MPEFTSAQIVASTIDWVRKGDSAEDIWKGLSDANKELALLNVIAGLALRVTPIAEAIHNFLSDLVDAEISRRNKVQRKAVWADIEAEIVERETLHGPCPGVLRHQLADHCEAKVRTSWDNYITTNAWSRDCKLPESFGVSYKIVPAPGTPLRKQYNNWMRKKVKQGVG